MAKYTPLQIPYILSKAFSETLLYAEEIVPDYQDFLICLWNMQPIASNEKIVENIIVTDACIDLVANYKDKWIGFVGMSKTNFEYKIKLSHFIGARFKPDAFHNYYDQAHFINDFKRNIGLTPLELVRRCW